MVWLGKGQFRWSIGTNGTIGTNVKAPYSSGSMQPLREVKLLFPIESDESFLKVVLNWQILYCCSIHGACLSLQIECFNFIHWVPSFRKANVNYREIVTY